MNTLYLNFVSISLPSDKDFFQNHFSQETQNSSISASFSLSVFMSIFMYFSFLSLTVKRSLLSLPRQSILVSDSVDEQLPITAAVSSTIDACICKREERITNNRVFIKYCVFPYNVVNFLNSAFSAVALLFYLPGVCTYTH